MPTCRWSPQAASSCNACTQWPAQRRVVRAAAAAGSSDQASRRSVSPTVDAKGLSYLGDSIWTLCVRRHFFKPPKHWKLYQDMVQPYVTAEGQACMYDALLSGAAGVAAEEQQLLATVRAQVADWRLRKRFNTVQAADAYRKATAFEALVGYLHLNDPGRLVTLTEGLLDNSSLRPPSAALQTASPTATPSASLSSTE